MFKNFNILPIYNQWFDSFQSRSQSNPSYFWKKIRPKNQSFWLSPQNADSAKLPQKAMNNNSSRFSNTIPGYSNSHPFTFAGFIFQSGC